MLKQNFKQQSVYRFQKWLSFYAVLVSFFMLILLSLTLCNINTPFLVTLFSTCLFSLILLEQREINAQISQSRVLNLQSAKEKKLKLLVDDLARKIGVELPTIYVKNRNKSISLEVMICGFLFNNILFISQETLIVYQKRLTQESVKALIAHELSHLKNHDHFLSLILNTIRVMSASLGIFILIRNSALGLFFVLSGVILSQMLLYAAFTRAQEYVADFYSYFFTQNPNAVKRFIYDRYLQFLYFGKYVIENECASQADLTGLSVESKACLKSLYRSLSCEAYQSIYANLKSLAQDNCAPNGVVQHLFTWLNSHPTIDERVSHIEQARIYKVPSRQK